MLRALRSRPGAACRAAAALLLGGTLSALPGGSAPLGAQIVVFDGERASLGLSGYLRGLTGVHDRGFDIPGAETTSGFHGEVLRLKWRLEAGPVIVDVHNRVQARVSSDAAGGRAIGFGVSAVPARSLDLSSDWISRDRLRVWHDLDRLSVAVRTGFADFTLGRQPITWGISAIFPVADLWTAFSPFELDTEEKPGIDAVRALAYPADGLEVDAVVADRGSLEHLSAGVRATWSLSDADLWAGAGKLWDLGMLMGGVSLLLDETRLRAEAVLPVAIDDAAFQRPRATAGFDWIRGRFSLTGEAHYNGLGAPTTDGYVRQAASPGFNRGESYFLGRYYLGAAASWAPDEQGRLRLALSSLLNLADGSAALTPLLDYDLGPATSVSLGGLVSFGQTPLVALPPRLRSEFGAYGDLVFTRVSVYF